MSLLAGSRLGRYKIIGPLGKGGMGEVYRARDTQLDREVAIKVLPEHLAQDPDALKQLLRNWAAQKRHSNFFICVVRFSAPQIVIKRKNIKWNHTLL